MSATIASKSAVPSGWKTIAALPALLRSISVSSVTPAVLIANRRSGAGFLILRLAGEDVEEAHGPSGYAPALELRLEPLQRLDPLLHRRVRREQAADRRLRPGGKK